mgnify:FL=1
MSKKEEKKPLKDHKYWELHKEIFEENFWKLELEARQAIADNPYCKTAKRFEKKLEKLVLKKIN